MLELRYYPEELLLYGNRFVGVRPDNEQQRIDLIRMIWLLEMNGLKESELCGDDLCVRCNQTPGSWVCRVDIIFKWMRYNIDCSVELMEWQVFVL